MTDERKQEIIVKLQTIYQNFQPIGKDSDLTMFNLVSRYNALGNNPELIGGDWVVDNCPEPLCSLPV